MSNGGRSGGAGPPSARQYGVMSSLARPRTDRVIAGVCSGLARRFGMKPLTVRILAVALVLFAGLSLWAYVLMWILMPNED